MKKYEKLKLALAQVKEAEIKLDDILTKTFNIGDDVNWRVRGHLQVGKVIRLARYTPEFGAQIKVRNFYTKKEYFISVYQVFEAEN